MDKKQCPGQRPRHWNPVDVIEITCEQCGQVVEFFKDDPDRPCPGCRAPLANPERHKGEAPSA